VSYLSPFISTQKISFSFLINSKASASLVSQSHQIGVDFSKYSKISGVKIYFPITQCLDAVSSLFGFSKNFFTLNNSQESSLSIIQ
jgi:hypothetical protein